MKWVEINEDNVRKLDQNERFIYRSTPKDCGLSWEVMTGTRMEMLYKIKLGHSVKMLDESPSVNDPSVLHNALKRLVDLKDLKDREGKSGYYETHQPAAWKQAREALAQYTAQSGEPDTRQEEFRRDIVESLHGDRTMQSKTEYLKNTYRIMKLE